MAALGWRRSEMISLFVGVCIDNIDVGPIFFSLTCAIAATDHVV